MALALPWPFINSTPVVSMPLVGQMRKYSPFGTVQKRTGLGNCRINDKKKKSVGLGAVSKKKKYGGFIESWNELTGSYFQLKKKKKERSG